MSEPKGGSTEPPKARLDPPQLRMFLGFLCNILLLHSCEDHFHLYSLSAVHTYDLYHIHLKIHYIYVSSNRWPALHVTTYIAVKQVQKTVSPCSCKKLQRLLLLRLTARLDIHLKKITYMIRYFLVFTPLLCELNTKHSNAISTLAI